MCRGSGYTYLDGAQRVWNLVDKGKVFERAIQHPRLMDAMEYLLGEKLALSSFTTNIIGSGSQPRKLHIDSPLSSLLTPRPSFPMVANSMWFLDDYTPENGDTRVVPGSHLRFEVSPDPEATYDDEIQVTAKKLKPQKNQLELISQKVVERATPKLKQSLGCDSMPQTFR